VSVSGVDSVRVRVHLNERRFRQKPVKRVPSDEVHVGVTHDTGGALGDVTDQAWFCRTTATRIWGVSDPSFQAAEPRQEGGRGGRSRPRCLLTSVDCRAHSDPGGTKRRPLHCGEVAHSQGHRPGDLHSTAFTPPRVSIKSRAPRRGNTPPESVFPLLFVNRSPTVRNQEGWDEDPPTRVGSGYEEPCEPLRGSILTRVPPSSIDRSAPRSMSSRCASRALATMRAALSESRS
jgi:hypothetical protein